MLCRRSVPVLLAGGCLALTASCGSQLPDTSEVARVVQSFNQAVTERAELDAILAHFAPGGVQFTLRPSHQGIMPEGLTTELVAHWSGVVPILFAATQAYVRQAEILDARVQGTVATVWASIRTETRLATAGDPNTETFTEVYLLVHNAAGWQIAAIADNRPPDDIDVSQ